MKTENKTVEMLSEELELKIFDLQDLSIELIAEEKYAEAP